MGRRKILRSNNTRMIERNKGCAYTDEQFLLVQLVAVMVQVGYLGIIVPLPLKYKSPESREGIFSFSFSTDIFFLTLTHPFAYTHTPLELYTLCDRTITTTLCPLLLPCRKHLLNRVLFLHLVSKEK